MLNDRLDRVGALRPARRVPAARAEQTAARQAESDSLAQLLGAVSQRNRYGEHLVLRRWFAEPAAGVPTPAALRLLAPDAPETAFDPDEWLFLDTETTGLAGGTGTYAFLAGVAWWDAGGLQVEQFFMRDHTEEHSLLLALGERLCERRVLVTFNGKSFDWPLLETRYLMTRQIPLRAPAAHLDLLHPARRLWRLRLGSLRLTEIERQVLAPASPAPGWDRRDDIPSHLIPQVYFDYLRGGTAEPLVSVFRHNQMDLRGLAALAARMLAVLEEPESAEGDALDLYGLSRLLRHRGHRPRARRLYERALRAGLPLAVDRAARRELAALAKRDRDFARATSLWDELIGSADVGAGLQTRPVSLTADDGFPAALHAYEQLAIYYEHHARDPHRAAALTREALAALQRAWAGGALELARYRKLKARLHHRLARLTRTLEAKDRKPLFALPRRKRAAGLVNLIDSQR